MHQYESAEVVVFWAYRLLDVLNSPLEEATARASDGELAAAANPFFDAGRIAFDQSQSKGDDELSGALAGVVTGVPYEAVFREAGPGIVRLMHHGNDLARRMFETKLHALETVLHRRVARALAPVTAPADRDADRTVDPIVSRNQPCVPDQEIVSLRSNMSRMQSRLFEYMREHRTAPLADVLRYLYGRRRTVNNRARNSLQHHMGEISQRTNHRFTMHIRADKLILEG